MFKNGNEEEIVLVQDFALFVIEGEEVSFTDTKRGYVLRLNYTFTDNWMKGQYNLWVNEVAYDTLDLAEEDDLDYSR